MGVDQSYLATLPQTPEYPLRSFSTMHSLSLIFPRLLPHSLTGPNNISNGFRQNIHTYNVSLPKGWEIADWVSRGPGNYSSNSTMTLHGWIHTFLVLWYLSKICNPLFGPCIFMTLTLLHKTTYGKLACPIWILLHSLNLLQFFRSAIITCNRFPLWGTWPRLSTLQTRTEWSITNIRVLPSEIVLRYNGS